MSEWRIPHNQQLALHQQYFYRTPFPMQIIIFGATGYNVSQCICIHIYESNENKKERRKIIYFHFKSPFECSERLEFVRMLMCEQESF